MILIFFQLYKVLNIFPILKIILKTLGEDVPFKLRNDRQYLDDDFRCADLGVDVVGTNQQSYFIPLKILQQPHQVTMWIQQEKMHRRYRSTSDTCWMKTKQESN